MEIVSFNLEIEYKLDSDDTLAISKDTADDLPYNLSIIGKDKNHATDYTTISFYDNKEIKNIIKDFNSKFKLLKLVKDGRKKA